MGGDTQPGAPIDNMGTPVVNTNQSDWDPIDSQGPNPSSDPNDSHSTEASDTEWDAVSDTSDWAVTMSAKETEQAATRVEFLENRVATLEKEREEITHDLNSEIMEKRFYNNKYIQQVDNVRELRTEMNECNAGYLKDITAILVENDQLQSKVEFVTVEKEELQEIWSKATDTLVAEINTLKASLSQQEETYEAKSEELREEIARVEDALETQLSQQAEAFEKETDRLEAQLWEQEDDFKTEKKELETRLSHQKDTLMAEKKQLEKILSQQADAFMAEKKQLETRLTAEKDALTAKEAQFKSYKGLLSAAHLLEKAKQNGIVAENKDLEMRLSREAMNRLNAESKMKGLKVELENKLLAAAEEKAQLLTKLEQEEEKATSWRLEANEFEEQNSELYTSLADETWKVQDLEVKLEDAAVEMSSLKEVIAAMEETQERDHKRLEVTESEAAMLKSKITDKEETALEMESKMKELEEERQKALEDVQIQWEDMLRWKTASILEHQRSLKSQQSFDAQIKASRSETESKMQGMADEKQRLNLAMDRFTTSLKKTASELNVRVRSVPPSGNWIDGMVSVAIHGNYFVFHGPKYASM